MKLLRFSEFIFEEEKVYQGISQTDPYSYKVVNGVWFTKGPNIPDWKSLEKNTLSNDRLDKAFPDARKSADTATATTSTSSSQTASSQIAASSLVSNFGKFTPASSKTAPLVIVFGGIPVSGRQSGDYMYDYFNKTGNKYNLFVAKTHKVDGSGSYSALLNKIKEDGITPSKKILYLFSGGYAPGMTLLQKVGVNEFDKIYLVDIWMGNSTVADFYKKIAADNSTKVEYFYTDYGANNPTAKQSIASTASNSVKNSANNHMLTNVDAINSLEKIA